MHNVWRMVTSRGNAFNVYEFYGQQRYVTNFITMTLVDRRCHNKTIYIFNYLSHMKQHVECRYSRIVFINIPKYAKQY